MSVAVIALLMGLGLAACSVKKPSSRTQVKGSSMEPTLGATDYVDWDAVEPGTMIGRGDLVIMKSPLSPESFWARRVVGLGGESIKIEVAGLGVDGKMIPWSEIVPGASYPSIDKKGEFRVPGDHFFCIGDNLNNARDSREFGAVSRDKIVGKITKIDKGAGAGK